MAVLFGALLVMGLGYTTLGAMIPMEHRLWRGVVIIWLAILFALFPDIDIKSKGQKLFYWLFFLLDVGLLVSGRFIEAALLGFVAMLPILSRHRGWTHSIWAMLLVPLPILAGPVYLSRTPPLEALPFYLGAVAGYLSHLVADGTLLRRRA